MKLTTNVSGAKSWLTAGAAAALIGLAAPSTALAQDVLDLPAGLACEFELQVTIDSSTHRVYKEFYDKNGNLVRVLTAGKGDELSFANSNSGATLSLKGNGSVAHVALHPDGTQTWRTTGHNVLILFPTDVPAGPSTTLYMGRVVFTVDTSGVFTLRSTSGKSMDICAALSN
jgi:hypothetical protein